MNKRHTHTFLGAFAFGCLFLSPLTAQAQTTAFVFGTGVGTNNGKESIGLEFEVVAPLGISVSDYGAFDSNQDGFFDATNAPTSLQIQMYQVVNFTDTTGTPVGSTLSIPGSAPLDAGTGSRFSPLGTALTLLPGKYVIAGWGWNPNELHGDPLFSPPPTLVTNSGAGALDFTGAVSRFSISNANLDFPSFRNGFLQKTGPTFKFTTNAAASPEPGTLALLGTGIIGFFVRRRKK
jgi:hypothetical protein